MAGPSVETLRIVALVFTDFKRLQLERSESGNFLVLFDAVGYPD
jgi:hypothetical protein